MIEHRLFNYILFAALMVSTYFGFQFLWGALFVFWTIQSLRSGSAFLLSSVNRAQDPVLFWMVQITWLVLGLMMLTADFFPAVSTY